VKHDPRGIVDVEFAVQYLVLAHAADHDALTGNVGNIALLKLTESLGLLPRGIGTAAADAYRAYRRRQHALRLRGDRYARVAPDELAEERSAVLGLWTTVFGD
jgi:glutamate-ammonia-ligase adenylyltransferase